MVYENVAKVLTVDFLLENTSFFSKILFFLRRKDNKDNGMVLAEVGLPCGFKGDLSKTNARGLDHKEAMSDQLVLYFKNVRKKWLFCK